MVRMHGYGTALDISPFQSPLEAFGGAWLLKKPPAFRDTYPVRYMDQIPIAGNFLLYRATMFACIVFPNARRLGSTRLVEKRGNGAHETICLVHAVG